MKEEQLNEEIENHEIREKELKDIISSEEAIEYHQVKEMEEKLADIQN